MKTEVLQYTQTQRNRLSHKSVFHSFKNYMAVMKKFLHMPGEGQTNNLLSHQALLLPVTTNSVNQT